MEKAKVLDEYECLFIQGVIDYADCLEIQLVRGRVLKMEAIDYPFDRDEIGKFCDNCPHYPI
jgi:hypothetical protein